MAEVESAVDHWLRENAIKLYNSPLRDVIFLHVTHALRAFPSIHPKTEVYSEYHLFIIYW